MVGEGIRLLLAANFVEWCSDWCLLVGHLSGVVGLALARLPRRVGGPVFIKPAIVGGKIGPTECSFGIFKHHPHAVAAD
jgi:hypothetical protein